MEDKSKSKVIDNLRQFTNESSMHGVKFLLKEDHPWLRRIIWFALISGSLVLFGLSAGRFISDFLKLKVNTKTKVLNAQKLTYPTVTICNRNLWRNDMIYQYSMKLYNDTTFFMIFNDLYEFSKSQYPIPEEKYNASYNGSTYLPEMNSSEIESFFESLAHSATFGLHQCFIQEAEYPCDDIFDLVVTDGGYCAQFNGNGSFEVAAAGSTGGLRLILNAQTYSYSVGPKSYSEGFLIAFHDSDEVPLVTELGVGVSVGMESAIVLHKSEISRQPPPADGNTSECFDSKSLPNPLSYYKSYSYSGCMVECKTNYVISICGCRDVLQPAINNSRICTLREMLYCSSRIIKKFASDPDGLKLCDCPDPCKDTEYNAQVSSFRFPNTMYARILGANDALLNDLGQNYAVVEIYFGKMSYTSLEESIAFDGLDMIAYLGGTLGLCIGASLLSLCELIEFLLLSAAKLVRRLACPEKNTNVVHVKSVEFTKHA